MENSKGNQTTATFFTEPKQRPMTSHVVRNKTVLRQQFALDPEIDPSNRLRTVKGELKHLQSQYVSMITRVNDSKKVIDTQFRHSQRRKVQFLNLYEHRRLKMSEQKLLDEKQQEEQRLRQGLREKTKAMKLNGEVRSLLLHNEIEENNSQACSRNRLAKQKHKQNIQRQRERELSMARTSFARIKKGQIVLHEKKRRISEMQSTIARTNYVKKLGDEVGAVERLDKMLNQMCNEQFCEDCMEPNPTAVFLTEKSR